MAKTVTFISKTGQKKTYTVPEGRRTVISSSGVRSKTVKIPVKGKKDPVTVPRKVAGSIGFTNITGEPEETVTATRTVPLVGPGSTKWEEISGRSVTSTRSVSFKNVRDQSEGTVSRTERQVNAQRFRPRPDLQTPISGYSVIPEEQLLYGLQPDYRKLTPDQTPNELRRFAYRGQNIPSGVGTDFQELKRLGSNLGSIGLGGVASVTEGIIGVGEVTKSPSLAVPIASNFVSNTVSTVKNPASAYTDLRVKASTPEGFGSTVGEFYVAGKVFKGGRALIGKGVDEFRFATSTYTVPVELLAESNVVSGGSRLNVGSIRPVDLTKTFGRQSAFPFGESFTRSNTLISVGRDSSGRFSKVTKSPIQDSSKTGAFATTNRLADYDVIRGNRDLSATSVAPVTASSPQFALPKSGGSIFSSSEVSLFPGRRQSTLALLETERGFTLLPGKGPVPIKLGESIVEGSRGRSIIYESPKYAKSRKGLGEQEGNIPKGAFVNYVEEGVFKPTLFQRITGGGSVYTRFQGKPIRVRKGVVETNALEIKPTKGFRGVSNRINVSIDSSSLTGTSGSIAGFLSKRFAIGSSFSRSNRSNSLSSYGGSYSKSSPLLRSGSSGRKSSSKSLISSSNISKPGSFSSPGSSSSSYFSSYIFSSGLGSGGSSFGRGSSFNSGSSFTTTPPTTNTKFFKDLEGKYKLPKGKRQKGQLFLPTSNLLGLTTGKGIKVKTGKELLPGIGLARLKL